MQIIGGKYKGQQIFSARDHSIRPTTNKNKEFIFNILGDFIFDANVVDLFCGSGNLGLEAASRGAKSVTFVDNSSNSIRVLKRNIERINPPNRLTVIKREVLKFLRQNKKSFDLILVDPPFRWNHYIELLPLCFLEENLTEYGIVVLESEITHNIEWETNIYEMIRQKKSDRSLITFFGRKNIV